MPKEPTGASRREPESILTTTGESVVAQATWGVNDTTHLDEEQREPRDGKVAAFRSNGRRRREMGGIGKVGSALVVLLIVGTAPHGEGARPDRARTEH